MPTKKAKRIQLLFDLAKRKEEHAARDLAQQQAMLNEQKEKLQTLRQYYGDYEKQFTVSRTSAVDLARSRAFLSNLQQALSAQQQAIYLLEQQVERARQLWQKQHHKSKAIDDYGQRNKKNEQQLLNKSEQKLQDELAGRRSPYRR